MSVSPEQFVKKYMEAYKNGENKRWIATELNLANSTVSTRVSILRAKGVRLPALKNGIPPIYPEALNKIIEETNHE